MNQLQVNDLFEGAIINSPNREKDHEDSMILVLHNNQETQADFWRIESDPNTQYGVLYSLLFTLAIQIRVVRLQVYADFAVVQFEDQSINFIERPQIEGEAANYIEGDLEIGDGLTNVLRFDNGEEIIEWVLLPSDSDNTYILTISYAS